jgi:tetratricopeptide (TPR) repeat protein
MDDMERARFCNEAARGACHSGDIAQEVFHRSKAVEALPDSAQAWVLLGAAQRDQGELGASRESLERAVLLAQKVDSEVLGHAWRELGITLMDLGRDQGAADAFRKNLTLLPDHDLAGVVHVFLGVLQRRMRRFEEAERSFRKALEIEPNNEEAMFNLAMLLEDADLRESIALLRRAVEIAPEYTIAYRELGRMLGKGGNATEAEAVVRKSAALDDRDPLAHRYLARILEQQGRIQESQEEKGRAAQLESK